MFPDDMLRRRETWMELWHNFSAPKRNAEPYVSFYHSFDASGAYHLNFMAGWGLHCNCRRGKACNRAVLGGSQS